MFALLPPDIVMLENWLDKIFFKSNRRLTPFELMLISILIGFAFDEEYNSAIGADVVFDAAEFTRFSSFSERFLRLLPIESNLLLAGNVTG